jgi:hypothetical protein
MAPEAEFGQIGPEPDAEFEAALNRAYETVREGDAVGFESVLEECPRVAEDLNWSLPLLDRAVECGHEPIVARLLKAGVPANAIGDDGVTPLMRAAWGGYAGIIRRLLDAGADPDILPEAYDSAIPIEQHGRSALFCAMDRGHKDVIRVLKKVTSANVRKKAREALDRLRLEQEDEEEPGPALPSRAEMALLHAIFLKQPEGIGPALAAGADINRQMFQEKSLLWHAAYHGNRSLTRLLLEHGADPNAPGDSRGETPLTIAVRMGRAEVIAELLAAGADPALADASGLTTWDYARRPLCKDGSEALRQAWDATYGADPARS